ncbi:MAG TPA: hypothetical protein V6C65_26510, partial [Allocoleopsis sp.]
RGGVTTEPNSSTLEPEEVADALELIQLAIEVQSLEGLRAVWECWDDRQRQQIWGEMGELLQREVESVLQHLGSSEESPSMKSFRTGFSGRADAGWQE